MDYGHSFSTFKKLSTEELVIAMILRRTLIQLEINSVLDVGGGTGRIVSILKQQLPWIAIDCVEISPKRAQCLRRRTDIREVFTSDASTFSPPRTYDLIVFSHVTGHFSPKMRAAIIERFSNKARVGLVVIANALVGKFRRLQYAIWREVQDYSYFEDYRYLLPSLQQFERLSVAGLKAEFSTSDRRTLSSILDVFSPSPLSPRSRQSILKKIVPIGKSRLTTLEIPQFVFLLSRRRKYPAMPPTHLSVLGKLLGSHRALWNRAHKSTDGLPHALRC